MVSLEQTIVDRDFQLPRPAGGGSGVAAVGFAVGEDEDPGRAAGIHERQRRLQSLFEIAAVGGDFAGELSQLGLVRQDLFDAGLASEGDDAEPMLLSALAPQVADQFEQPLILGHRSGAIGDDDDIQPATAGIPAGSAAGQQQAGHQGDP